MLIELVGGAHHGRRMQIPDGKHRVYLPSVEVPSVDHSQVPPLQPPLVYDMRILDGKPAEFDPGVVLFDCVMADKV